MVLIATFFSLSPDCHKKVRSVTQPPTRLG